MRQERSYGPPCPKVNQIDAFQFLAFASVTINTVLNIINSINANNNNDNNNNNNNLNDLNTKNENKGGKRRRKRTSDWLSMTNHEACHNQGNLSVDCLHSFVMVRKCFCKLLFLVLSLPISHFRQKSRETKLKMLDIEEYNLGWKTFGADQNSKNFAIVNLKRYKVLLDKRKSLIDS